MSVITLNIQNAVVYTNLNIEGHRNFSVFFPPFLVNFPPLLLLYQCFVQVHIVEFGDRISPHFDEQYGIQTALAEFRTLLSSDNF